MKQLKETLEAVQAWLIRSSGTPVVSSQTGPVGIGIIGDLVRVALSQEERIKALEQKVGVGQKQWNMR
jgi:hypothetical protein